MAALARFPTDPAAWQTYRRGLRGLGASDAGSALGIDPRRPAFVLWEQLTGRRERDASAVMERGSRFEDVAADWTADLTGWKLARVRHTVLGGPRWPHLFCHPDRKVVGMPRLVQIKTHWGDLPDPLPLTIQAQVQVEMALTRTTVATVAVQTFDGPPYLHEIAYDPETTPQLLDQLETWYTAHVEGDVPPRDTSAEYQRWLGREAADAGLARDATAEDLALVDAIFAAREAVAAAERDEAEYRTALMDAMKATGHSELLGRGFSLTWKRTKERTKTDWPSIAADFRRAAEGAGVEAGILDTLVSLHTTSEEGTRPFRLAPKGGPR